MTDTLPTAASTSRSAPRRPTRHIDLICRKGATGLGPNLAVTLLDVTEDRLKVRLKAAVPVGEDVEVELTPPGSGKSLKLRGTAVTCRASGGGTFVSKVLLRHRLTFRELSEITL
jgi:hypothetical protein